MTICEKWLMMIDSFTEIKAAIIEMGGTVAGGYASYPNGVRSICEESFTPYDETAYPVENERTIDELTAFCLEIKEQIREAIIDSGADVPENTPLSDYADKIRSIEAEKFAIVTSRLPEAERDVPYSASLEITGGKPPYVISISDTSPSQLPANLTLSTDGIISGIADTSAKTGTFRIIFKAVDSHGSVVQKEVRLSIREQSVDFKLTNPYVVYDGEPHKPIVVPADASFELAEGIDYKVTLGSENLSEITNMQLCRVYVTMLNRRYRTGAISPSMFGITQATPAINVESFSIDYDGLPHEAVYTISPAKLACIVTYTNLDTNASATEPPVEAGSYRVTVQTNDKNCVASKATGTITIM